MSQRAMQILHLSHYEPIPESEGVELFEVAVAALQPTQLCIGLAEIRSRQHDFARDTPEQQRRYLRSKPVPLVRNQTGDLWMIDRHHRLRALLELDASVTTFGYLVAEVASSSRAKTLRELQSRGWLYLHDGRGQGPWPPEQLPTSLLDLQDDPYRSLVWKLKKEGVLRPQPLIPYHEFRWGAWLRRRPLPPFHSGCLEPALPTARRLARSPAASHLDGWKGEA
jgi:hypothetical protein